MFYSHYACSLVHLLRVCWTIRCPVSECAFYIVQTIGATRAQRGLRARGIAHIESSDTNDDTDAYAFPPFVTRLISKLPFIATMPFMPNEKKSKQRMNICSVLTASADNTFMTNEQRYDYCSSTNI